MKTKLLKKVRKRFIIDFTTTPITVYDLKDQEIYLEPGMASVMYTLISRSIGIMTAIRYIKKRGKRSFKYSVNKLKHGQ